jgi:hypothetical protein
VLGRILTTCDDGSFGRRIGIRKQGAAVHHFFPEENDQARRMALAEGESFVWETTAKGYNDAHEAMYAFRGVGEYEPFLGDDGVPFPEDEDDDFQEEVTSG